LRRNLSVLLFYVPSPKGARNYRIWVLWFNVDHIVLSPVILLMIFNENKSLMNSRPVTQYSSKQKMKIRLTLKIARDW